MSKLDLRKLNFGAATALATVFGLGFIRFPNNGRPFGGTVASAVATITIYPLSRLNGFGTAEIGYIALVVGVTAVGIWASQFTLRKNEKDPKRIVIDEWVGVWVTAIWLPVTWFTLPAVFLMFRVLDMSKPLGIRRLEKLPGGIGVVLDDVGAGALGAILLNAAYWITVLIAEAIA